jgi:hypothetical protein
MKSKNILLRNWGARPPRAWRRTPSSAAASSEARAWGVSSCISPRRGSRLRGFAMAVGLQLGMLASSAQTNIYLYSGSETNITLPPGTYIITAYGAPGGGYYPNPLRRSNFEAGIGAELSAEFNFSASTTLTLLVGGDGGGGSFVVESSTPLVIAGGGGGAAGGTIGGGNGNISTNGGNGSTADYSGGGGTNGGGGGGFLGSGGDGYYTGFYNVGGYGGYGGGSYTGSGHGGGGGYGGGYGGGGGGGYYGGGGGGGGDYGQGVFGGGGGSIIDSSAIAILTEVSGILSPDDSAGGEIIITAAPLAIITSNAAFGFTNGVFGFDVTGPAGSNVVIQASLDLETWIPLQTNLLGSGLLYFSDPRSSTNGRRFYRAQLSP